MVLWGKERTNEWTYTTTKHITTLLLHSRVKNGDSFIKAQCEFRRKFNLKSHDSVPSHLTMSRWLSTFWQIGAATNIRTKTSEKTKQTFKNIERVRNRMESASGSCRPLLSHAVASLHLSTATMHRILRKGLGYHPYKLQTTQTMLPVELRKRRDFGAVSPTWQSWHSQNWRDLFFRRGTFRTKLLC